MSNAPGPGDRDATSADQSADEQLPDRYSERELSWLAFNERVLDQARDRLRVPLLERAKFLAIFSSNLDEFFMVRVAGLKRRIEAGVAVRSIAGMMPRELRDAILTRAHELVTEQSRVFHEEVLPELTEQHVELVRWNQLTDAEHDRMNELFTERIYPVLTPLAVDPSHPFPYISGLSLNIAVLLLNPDTRGPPVRPHQGALDPRPLHQAGRHPLRAPRGSDPGPPVGAVHRHEGAAVHDLPGHPQ